MHIDGNLLKKGVIVDLVWPAVSKFHSPVCVVLTYRILHRRW